MNGWIRPGGLGAGAGIGACMLLEAVVPNLAQQQAPGERVELQIRLHAIEQQLERCERSIQSFPK